MRPALWRNRCSTSASTSDGATGSTRGSASRAHVLDLADLEAAGPQMRMVGEIALDLLVARRLDHPEAAQDFLGLGEGAVGDGDLTIDASDHTPPLPQLLA